MSRKNALVVMVAVGLGLLGPACKSRRNAKDAEAPDAMVAARPAEAEPRTGLSQSVRKRGRAMALRVRGAEHVEKNDHVDLVALVPDPKANQRVALTVLQNVIVLGVKPAHGAEASGWDLTVLVLPEEAEILGLARKVGRLQVSLRNPEDVGDEAARARATLESLIYGERAKALFKKRLATIQVAGKVGVVKLGPSATTERLSGQIPKRGRALTLSVLGLGPVRPGDQVDLLWAATGESVPYPVSQVLLEQVPVLRVDGAGVATVQVLPEEAEMLVLAADLGDLTALLRNPEDLAAALPRSRVTLETLITGERVKALKKKRDAVIQVIRLPGGGGGSPSGLMHGSLGSYTPPPAAGRTEQYEDHGVNPWTETLRDRLSTFAVDVDTGSYTIARRKLREGVLPPPAAVRTEEFINYFRYAYPAPREGAFGVSLDAAPSPFGKDRYLLRVGLKGRTVKPAKRKPVHLTFLVDTSGSMQSSDKIGLVKRSLRFLVDQLEAGDTVALATYAGHVAEVLRPTGMGDRRKIHEAIEALTAGGSTAMASGLGLAYDLAWRDFKKSAVNRVIVLSDGDANVGATGHGDMLTSIKYYADRGVTLSAIGFGMGNYKDHKMEQLADQGNGNYAYIDSYSQAKRVFGEDLAGTLQVIAKDVKVQVEFDPAAVERYRLVGYENRDIADHDFRNDKVDAGEIGAGHAVTALYELELRSGVGARERSWGTVYVRWKEPEGSDRAAERSFPIQPSALVAGFDKTSLDFQRAVVAAGLAEHLRDSPARDDWAFDELRTRAKALARRSRGKAAVDDDELLALIEVAGQLMAKDDKGAEAQ